LGPTSLVSKFSVYTDVPKLSVNTQFWERQGTWFQKPNFGKGKGKGTKLVLKNPILGKEMGPTSFFGKWTSVFRLISLAKIWFKKPNFGEGHEHLNSILAKEGLSIQIKFLEDLVIFKFKLDNRVVIKYKKLFKNPASFQFMLKLRKTGFKTSSSFLKKK
jgi:hypothetical protein